MDNGATPRSGSAPEADSSFAVSAPQISLPKGGGAIRGIGEKFGANPVTGTGSLTVPLAITPGRSGFGPQLSLAYDSGSGNGPFGFGWRLSVPSITRKTDKGLPRYFDDEESDVFILSDAEDLVPTLLERDSGWQRERTSGTWDGQVYLVQLYQPRIEGLSARIERWQNESTGPIFWKTVSKDNIASLYGPDESQGTASCARKPDRIRARETLEPRGKDTVSKETSDFVSTTRT